MFYVDVHRTQWAQMRVNVAHVTDSAIRSQLFQVEEDLIDDANQYSASTNTTSVHTGTEVDLPASTRGWLDALSWSFVSALPTSPVHSSHSRAGPIPGRGPDLFAGGFGLTHQIRGV